MLISKNRHIKTDAEGYLKNVSEWQDSIADLIAEKEKIQLTPEHWEVIYFLRNFYMEFHTSPAMRILVKALKIRFGEKIGNSRYLHYLFPKGPARQAAKIAGLPKPVKCI